MPVSIYLRIILSKNFTIFLAIRAINAAFTANYGSVKRLSAGRARCFILSEMIFEHLERLYLLVLNAPIEEEKLGHGTYNFQRLFVDSC